ncbi:ABC transporter substrate-binding protein [Aliiroseovarius crassostreae]|uniref:ABC transporter substrate-binding protein n=1 Tax=Aliiroseovarius crassostreae TaxID=154981 RepID=A0A9Q9LSZ2_9RHOB|nr:ABC transporter substrate-binding protein [Aliiroseovarius crassostreae]UWP88317.1 ABC transporter substrate-binding protein [Aliiroseovarius crassostreae]UWP91476.1 ABC transporter substrate-binding protein [Aliiroseovarius crassostreae]UWP94650.1 ABC transporter substrate-binding protein [Aliiroseovarius crassostreae]UWP97795.1 ABC transporter substrate-binding protein [Aliiroseovarius crassostreae]UWQ10355.1 ABC transporter substrate-binding protein [Aliiroseovarius crassostreae]
MKHATLASALMLALAPPALAEDITVGFAIAKSGWMEAYDSPAATAAKIRIDEINAAGGLLGQQIKWVEVDTKTDRAQSAKAGLQVLDDGADMMVVSCDYDFGAPAALAAEAAGINSFFLCAEDVKAGIQGVGPNSFSGSVLAAVQGATMAEWSQATRDAKTGYVLLDTTIEYNKGICTGFDWMFPKAGGEVVGRDTFKNNDASIASQISRIKALPEEPDVIMLCSYIPGAAAAVRQLRAAGINSLILNGSAVDGSYWLDAVPDLSGFVLPVQGSIYGDDPRAAVESFNQAYEAATGARPASQYAYPGYILIDLWAKAVERAGRVEGAAVTAELEKMQGEATAFGPRSFSDMLHHQNSAEMQIIEISAAKPGVVGNWTISEPVPLDVLLK